MSLRDQTTRVIDVLRGQGPLSARDLAQALGVSQPTVSRAMGAAGGEVVRIGRARRAYYAVRREVRGLGSTWPLFRIGTGGKPQAFGELTALHGGGSLVTTGAQVDWLRDDFADGLFPGVPWFLDDQRPQGFLGRQFAQRWSREWGLSSDILRWDDDAVLAVLLLHGDQGVGNFILGERAFERAWQAPLATMPSTMRSERYGELAAIALAGEPVGSSAAGEQPKFTTVVADDDGSLRHVIVKFSEPVDSSAAARRWADLLIGEHVAAEMLAEWHDSAARTELIWSHGRLCLEVTRFDRVGAHGRRGTVTLAAWSDAHDGERDGWLHATTRMAATGWLTVDEHAIVRRRWLFGRLIGNTDMHFGNLSFFSTTCCRCALRRATTCCR